MILVPSRLQQLSGNRTAGGAWKTISIKLKIMKKYIITIVVTVAGLFLPVTLNAQFLNEQTMKLDKTLRLIDAYYVDTVNRDKLVEDAIIALLKDLDPHSVYVTKEEVKAMNEPLVGNFEGIGVQFNILNDTIFIISPISGGPSEKLGIRAGDRIVSIDGEIVAGKGISNKGVRDRLLGKKGTKVYVQILRRGETDLLDFTIVRDKIPIFSLDASYMMDSYTGYMRFNRFSATTMKEFREASASLKQNGMKNLVLDLRGNGGGLLDAAADMADEFLEKDRLIVYMQGKQVPRQDYKASSAGGLEDARLIVLIDEGSASASEIVTGAVQDWDRGLVIGRRSFGKGLVQRPFYLADGSMIRLTIARYYTPSGRLIQRSYSNGSEDYFKDFTRRFNHGELLSADSIQFPDSLKYSTRLNGRTVYGGGGIMPDIFIPIDTTLNYTLYNRLISKGVMSDYVLSYTDDNRKKLEKRYGDDFESFKKEFQVSDEMYSRLLARAEKEGMTVDPELADSSEEKIKLLVKALMARDLWDMSEYFEMINSADPVVMRALEVMQESEAFTQKLSGN